MNKRGIPLKNVFRKYQSSQTMKPLSILQHMKLLKTAIPQKQNEEAGNSQLPVFRKLKSLSKHLINQEGIFAGLKFCLWFKQGADEKETARFGDIVLGVYKQGGQIVQFIENMGQKFVKYVIADSSVNINHLRIKLAGSIKFQMILSTQFVSDSLKSLKRKDFKDYILFDNTTNIKDEVHSSIKAKERLQKQQLDTKLIRPSLQNNQTEKNSQLEDKQKQTQKQQSQLNNKDIDSMYQFFQSYQDSREIQQQEHQQNSPQTDLNMNIAKNEKSQQIKDPFNSRGYKHKHDWKQQLKKQKQIEEKRQAYKKHLQQNQLPIDPSVPWVPKRDRKLVWYDLPKNLASHSFAMNNLICEKLLELHQYYKRVGDLKHFNYFKAIPQIRAYDKEIKTVDDLRSIVTLSQGMIKIIKEIIETGKLKRLQKISHHQDINVRKQLEKVLGVGQKRAKQLYEMGIKTVQQLRKRPDLINKNMAIGLKYFDQLSKRIPRQKVTRIFQYFKKIFYGIVFTDKLHHLQVVGSYRRGKLTCGDIDILICRHDGSIEDKLMQKLIAQLQQKKFITESLTTPKLFDGKTCSIYMGICNFQGQNHRIDIKQYPVNQYAFALMYFTGSDVFNRALRQVAHNKGLMLSDHGIKTKQRNGKEKCWKGGKIPILKTEKQIFQFLDQDYCTPVQRQM